MHIDEPQSSINVSSVGGLMGLWWMQGMPWCRGRWSDLFMDPLTSEATYKGSPECHNWNVKGIYLQWMTLEIFKLIQTWSSDHKDASLPSNDHSFTSVSLFVHTKCGNSSEKLQEKSGVFSSNGDLNGTFFPIPSHLTMAGYWVKITCSPYLPYFEFSRVLS